MRKLLGLLLAGLALAAPGKLTAQGQPPVLVANVVELSGDGAIAGTNFNNGVLLAVKEINAAGGILGHRIETLVLDTQTRPELAKAAFAKAVELDAFAVTGPVFSGMVLAVMDEIRAAGIPTFVGGEATSLTEQGNPYLFRTSLSQARSMPRLARYLKDGLRAKSVAMVWVDNEFGRGGRDAMTKALGAEGIEVVADIATQPEQMGFDAVVEQVRQSGADVAFIYLNERESADLLRPLFRLGFGGWIVGETTLMGQSVLDLAGEAANAIRGHVGLTADALVPSIRAFSNAFLQEHGYKSDHNGMKGYIAVHVLKAAIEQVGSLDRAAVVEALHGLALSAREHPGILLDVRYDEKGDLDRASFIVRVSGSRHEFVAMLPATAGSY
jgi:branched-chain amino acid transport system substrate-binding protein